MATAEPLRPQNRQHAQPASPIATADAQVLVAFLARAARRRNGLCIARHVTRAMIPAAVGSTLGVLAHRFYLVSLPENIAGAALPTILLASAALAGAIGGFGRRVGLFEAAREADRHFKLHDLLGSALSFARPQNSRHAIATPFVPPLVSQAASQARGLSIGELYPLRLDRPAQVLAISLLALLGASLMADNPYFLSAEQKKLNATLKIEGEKMQRAAQATREDKRLGSDARAQIAARRTEALAQRMQAGRMTRKQALLSLDQLKREVQGAGKPNNSTPSEIEAQRLRDALAAGSYQTEEARRMQAELGQKRDGEAARKLDELATKVEKSASSGQAERDKAAADVEEAARALRRAGQANDEAARALEQAARALRQNQNPNSQTNQASSQQQQQDKAQQHQGPQGTQREGQNGPRSGEQRAGKAGAASDELRKLAEKLRANQAGQANAGSQSAREMMRRIEEAERSAGGGQPAPQSKSSQNQQGQNQSGPSQSGQNPNPPGQGANQNQTGRGAGQGGQKGQGTGKDGKAAGAGKGPGASRGNGAGESRQSVAPGGDLRPSNPTKGAGGGAGLGPRSQIKGGQGSGGGVSRQRAATANDSRRWADVWSDRLPQPRAQTDRIMGKMGSGGESERLQTRGEARGGAARTPYTEVYESYKRDAEDAIARENVPPAYRDSVKQYFDRMKP